MKFEKFPIELICSKDQFRPSMAGVYIDNGYAVATDGMALVIMKLSDMDMQCLEKLDGHIIKSAVFKKINARKLYLNVTESGQIDIDGDIIGNPFIDGTFPNYRNILPDKTGELAIIGFDAELMANIQKAFNTNGLAISFGESSSRAINIKPNFTTVADFQAICMPVMTYDKAKREVEMQPFTVKAPAIKEVKAA